jgi:hypothetical protein
MIKEGVAYSVADPTTGSHESNNALPMSAILSKKEERKKTRLRISNDTTHSIQRDL